MIDLNQPQIAAAIVGGVVAALVTLVVTVINQRSLRSMHTDKLKFEREQAERRTTSEITLAERKSLADVGLAERKFALDRALAIWRRQFELAEQILAAAYEARAALHWARGRVRLSDEGKTRVATEPESEKLKAARDAAFVPIERLAKTSKPFATLQTLQDTVSAHFGPDSAQSIASIIGVHHSITSAASVLIQIVYEEEDRSSFASIAPLHAALWGEGAEADSKKLDVAIAQLEAICRPVLTAAAPE